MKTTTRTGHILLGMGIFSIALLMGATTHASNHSYNDFRGEITDIQEDASTTRVYNDRISLQHKRIDLLIEAVDEDGRLIDDDDRYRVVAVIDEDGYYGKTVSSEYKSREDAWVFSTTLGSHTDYITLYLLCDNCNTRYKFGHPGAYNRWNIVDAVGFEIVLDDDYSSKRVGRTSYRKWKNFEDYKGFFNQKNRYSTQSRSYKYGSSMHYYNYHEKHHYDEKDEYRLNYDRYSRKDYRSLGDIDYDNYYKKGTPTNYNYNNYGGSKCYSNRCAPTYTTPTNTAPKYTPTNTYSPCRSTTVGCGKPTYIKPTYEKPVVTKNYYYNNPTNNSYTPTTSTKVYQCSSNGCKWVYTNG